MKKIIQTLSIIILVSILAIIIIFVFNPLDLRTRLIGSVINSYLSSTIKNYETPQESAVIYEDALVTDKHPLLNADQEKSLEKYGVDVSKLPSSISPEMEACFIEKLGKDRAQEIVKGSAPGAIEVFKVKNCLGE